MPRRQKTIDEQLAEAKAWQDQIKARLHTLEVKKRQQESRTRAKGEMALMRILFEQIATQPGFKNVVAELVRVTPLRADEQEAIQWLLSSLDPPRARLAPAPLRLDLPPNANGNEAPEKAPWDLTAKTRIDAKA